MRLEVLRRRRPTRGRGFGRGDVHPGRSTDLRAIWTNISRSFRRHAVEPHLCGRRRRCVARVSALHRRSTAFPGSVALWQQHGASAAPPPRISTSLRSQLQLRADGPARNRLHRGRSLRLPRSGKARSLQRPWHIGRVRGRSGAGVAVETPCSRRRRSSLPAADSGAGGRRSGATLRPGSTTRQGQPVADRVVNWRGGAIGRRGHGGSAAPRHEAAPTAPASHPGRPDHGSATSPTAAGTGRSPWSRPRPGSARRRWSPTGSPATTPPPGCRSTRATTTRPGSGPTSSRRSTRRHPDLERGRRRARSEVARRAARRRRRHADQRPRDRGRRTSSSCSTTTT